MMLLWCSQPAPCQASLDACQNLCREPQHLNRLASPQYLMVRIFRIPERRTKGGVSATSDPYILDTCIISLKGLTNRSDWLFAAPAKDRHYATD